MTTIVADHITTFVQNLLAARNSTTPLFIGLQGPQGSGKTTACNAAVARLRAEHNLRGVTLSIDDFYMTRAEQVNLAARHAGNIYLSQRGYPGTHDIPLGVRVLDALRTINQQRLPVRIPRYDKSLHDGEGDRLPESAWPIIEAPLDFVLLEGWCVGFNPLPEAAIPNAQLAEVNRLLTTYRAWYKFLEAFIQLRTDDIRNVIDWRIEAEEKMRAQGKSAMSADKIRGYIERFLPAYELYLPDLVRRMSAVQTTAADYAEYFSKLLIIEIAADRSARYADFSLLRPG